MKWQRLWWYIIFLSLLTNLWQSLTSSLKLPHFWWQSLIKSFPFCAGKSLKIITSKFLHFPIISPLSRPLSLLSLLSPDVPLILVPSYLSPSFTPRPHLYTQWHRGRDDLLSPKSLHQSQRRRFISLKPQEEEGVNGKEERDTAGRLRLKRQISSLGAVWEERPDAEKWTCDLYSNLAHSNKPGAAWLNNDIKRGRRNSWKDPTIPRGNRFRSSRAQNVCISFGFF